MTAAYTPAQRIRIALIGGVLPLVIAAVGAWVLLGIDDLPVTIATHWNAAGTPDGFGTVSGTVILLSVVIAVLALLSTTITVLLRASAGSSYLPRVLVATSVWLSVFLVVGIGGIIWQQGGLVDAALAPAPSLALLVAFAIALPVAILAWIATPLPARLERPAAVSPFLELAPDERVLWVRSATPASTFAVVSMLGMVLVVGSAIVAAVVGGLPVFPLLIAPLVLVVLVLTTLFWRVRIDAAGFVARSALGLPSFAYPISDIAEARAVQLVPLREFGGWGIRVGTQGRLGVVLRAGEALEIERVDGRVFVITVDDASTAAGLVNGLVRRATLTR
jgi:hypothetical protein